MALSYSTNSYIGEFAKEWVADILLSGDTIDQGNISVHPNIKKAEKIQTISTDAIFQSRADSFNASGTTTVSERSLSPVNLMSQDVVGINALLAAYQSAQMLPGANNNDLPTEMGQFLINRKAEVIKNQIDELIWRGDVSLTGNLIRKWHDGLVTLAEADSAVTKYDAGTGALTPTSVSVGATTTLGFAAAVTTLYVGDKVKCKVFTGADAATLNDLTFNVLDVSGSSVVIDAVTTGLTITTGANTRLRFINQSNVLSYLGNIMRVSSEAVVESPDFRIYVPVHVANAYIDANIAAGLSGSTSWERNGQLVYKDKVIAKQKFFPENTIFASRVGNLYFGTDLVSDQNEVTAKYMKDTTLDDVYRYSAKFSSSVNYGFASQIKMVRA